MNDLRYSVAIRTLGKGADKYEKELISIFKQSVQPEKVIVYIAEGYKIPDFRIGKEEYVFVKKGMVAQRALDYAEIDSPYILLLDDDVYLPDNAVEVLAKELIEAQGDVIAADTFHPQNNSWKGIIYDWLTSMYYPHYGDNWAFKVLRNASCSYQGHPRKRYYHSQTAAGPASFWKKSTMLSIHYKDETWLDAMGFAWGDDQLMFNKVYRNGHKLLVSYDSGIVHLDAKSASSKKDVSTDRWYKRAMSQYLVWYRSCYSLSSNSITERWLCKISFCIKALQGLVMHTIMACLTFSPGVVGAYLRGLKDGRRYSREILDHIPNFVLPSY